MAFNSSELTNAIVTALLTILGGITIFVIGQIVEKFFLSPLEAFRRTLGEIAFNMIYFANIYTNPGPGDRDTRIEASRKLRTLASQLVADSYAVNCFWFFVLFRFIPSRKKVNEASDKLIGLSNSVFEGNILLIDEWRKDISSLLRLHIFGR